jgi:FKBP-type peptidyl-prolyl cis-trans isomerase
VAQKGRTGAVMVSEPMTKLQTTLLTLALTIFLGLSPALGQDDPRQDEADDKVLTQGENYVLLKSGLLYEILTEGEGQIAETGNKVKVHYTGWLIDGTKFDSSKDRGKPFYFDLGAGRVIKGWDEGVKGMKIGEKRKLVIPSLLGYGSRGAGKIIPPNATLIFHVELLGI